MTTERVAADEMCRCGHPFSPHILLAGEDPMDGGLMFCQDPSCDCASTWSPEGRPRPVMPAPEAVAELRAMLHRQLGR
jgi:hypothetical protein